METEIERGKAAIIGQIRETIQTRQMDPTEFVFQWVEYFDTAHWNLNVYHGKRTRHLSLMEHDVEAWLENERVRGKYQPEIAKIIDWFQKKS